MAATSDYEQSREAGKIHNIIFKNIKIDAYSIIGDLETLWGTQLAPISGFVFDNVRIAGELIDGIDDFNHNEYVSDLKFKKSE